VSRSDQLLDAAITVLGTRGARYLTHRAVDAAAGLPAGSTSNNFRTRDALVVGIIRRVAERERQTWEALAGPAGAATADRLVVALAALLRQLTGPDRVLTQARFAIFVEVAQRPDLQPHLGGAMDDIRRWGAAWLAALGSTDPDRDCRLVLDHLDGALLHQLAFLDPAFDPEPGLRALLTGLLRT
jgi:DNA-binding transcriptional regulator YbjK